MSSTARPRAIIVGHGEFAAGMISAVEQITGMGELFVPLSNTGLSAADVLARLRQLVDANHTEVIFTDLPGGSCNLAAAKIAVVAPAVTVVTGVSLPVLLHYALHGDVPPRQAAEDAVARAIPALKVVARSPRGD
jgi:mannose/fructose-specific phosphotransferase system component IIA